jgi:hypothetical protein
MREKIAIIATIVVVIVVLIALNTATYVAKDETKDREWSPDRSTYHAGPTGTRALYDFLSESGYRVMRWREAPEKLLSSNGQNVQTFVVVGKTQLEFDDEQAASLLEWVARGGRLVLVDRNPQSELLPTSGPWSVQTEQTSFAGMDADPGNVQQMTETAVPLHPLQPTLLTRAVESVMPSRLATAIHITAVPQHSDSVTSEHGTTEGEREASGKSKEALTETAGNEKSTAPLLHIGNEKLAVLADYPHGLGRIVLVSDPYVFTNGGIKLQDNLQLAINVLTTPEGLLAFDEYHQNHGVTQNALIGYFSGTPILALCGQFALLMLLVLWTRARRFARPLPLPVIDRRSKLEFVASMAELQERAGAYDLAIENIYSRTRRALARYAGAAYNSPRAEIAACVAARSSLDARKLETLMRQCEETINGQKINWRQSLDLVQRLREVERALGLRMRSRDVRQAAENI